MDDVHHVDFAVADDLRLYPLASRQAGLGGKLLQFGGVLYVQGVCLIIIGYGMYKGRDELAEEDSSG